MLLEEEAKEMGRREKGKDSGKLLGGAENIQSGMCWGGEVEGEK